MVVSLQFENEGRSPTLDLSSLKVILSPIATLSPLKSMERSVPATVWTSLKLFNTEVVNEAEASISV